MIRHAKPIILFLIGGVAYYLIEILWRGYSHLSMFILGGICFLCIGLINESFTFEMPLWRQQLISTALVTTLEFNFGLVLNIIFKLNIWDYSHLPFNILGQICLPFTIAWFFLSLVAIILDDYLRYWLFNEEKPHYVLK